MDSRKNIGILAAYIFNNRGVEAILHLQLIHREPTTYDKHRYQVTLPANA